MDLSDETTIAELGRELGHDYHCLTRLPLQPDWAPCITEGFRAAAAAGHARRVPDRFQRKWLQLRLGAWQRGRAVAADVSAELLRELDIEHCPVTRERLTHGSGRDTDWSIDRLNNDGAYAAGNLAVMSTRANRAKGALSFDEVLLRSRQADAGDGQLTPAQWQRLAALMLGPAFATRHAMAPVLPLCAPLPVHSVRLACQQIQRLFTLAAARPAGKNALVRDFRPACPDEASTRRLRRLADAVHEELKRLDPAEDCWDVWLRPAPMQAFLDWKACLGERGWAQAAFVSARLAGGLRVDERSLAAWWSLPARGYVPGAGPTRSAARCPCTGHGST
ncbi:hypothetical protein [Pelomonas sp. KK5]|uniref:hypothetical protein n=1 Tax=Pelomonas sp. KK5 TaxID=1855730 RepID=UPI00117C893D|nr:hypothetical protein [Pelomonas sp. KK5]